MPHPDLVIVGPNPGNNLGAINSASGTFNVASVAVQAGIPALAVSTDLKEADPQRAAQLVAKLVNALDQHRQPDGALLPKGLGLNINLPKDPQIKGVKLTRIGSYVGFEAVYTDDLKQFKLPGKPGIGFQYSPVATAEQQKQDEAVWLNKGYLTISPFSGLPESINAGPALQKQLAREVQP
jgi:5'-nucleotidase